MWTAGSLRLVKIKPCSIRSARIVGRHSGIYKASLDATHQQFIARVREGRGERLTPGDEDVFDGRVWSGEQALVLGLVDSLAGPLEVAREWIGAEERIYYTQDEPLLNQFSREFGFGVGTALTWLGRQGILNPWSLSH